MPAIATRAGKGRRIHTTPISHVTRKSQWAGHVDIGHRLWQREDPQAANVHSPIMVRHASPFGTVRG